MKYMLLREAPKTLAHENLAMTNTTNGQDAKELNMKLKEEIIMLL